MLTKYELNFIDTKDYDGEVEIHNFENDFYRINIMKGKEDKIPTVYVISKVKYAPEINVSTFKGERQIKIQTTAHGSLSIDDYNHFIEGVTAGKYTAIAIEELLNESEVK